MGTWSDFKTTRFHTRRQSSRSYIIKKLYVVQLDCTRSHHCLPCLSRVPSGGEGGGEDAMRAAAARAAVAMTAVAMAEAIVSAA